MLPHPQLAAPTPAAPPALRARRAIMCHIGHRRRIAFGVIAAALCALAAGPAVSGTKSIKKPKASVAPCEWGTPGCPYPSFGRRRTYKTAPGEDCGKRMYKGGDGQCYPILN